MANNREQGRLKVYDPVKGFGFIERKSGKDAFVNYLEFEDESDATALVGALVEFEIKDGLKGPRAYRVRVVG